MNGPYQVVDAGRVLHVEYGPFISVRTNVSSDDVGNPANFDDCHDLTGWDFVDVYIKLSGTNPSWDITPIFGNIDGGSEFYDAETITVQKNEIRRIRLLGAGCLYFRCDGSAGTSPVIDSIKIRPVNVIK
jgi:hypothetical protein